ncbi:MAG: TIM barrel protein [Hyphomonadaceae bacterium]|nr:TIM barrel protein [Clostridia bacterium]
MIRFGAAGLDEQFYADGFSASVDYPKWLRAMGLSAYEFQGGRGIKIGKDKAILLGNEAKNYDIQLSVHAPYYINLANTDAEKQQNSINYILQSLQAAAYMGATRVTVHPGAVTKTSRQEALQVAKVTLAHALEQADEAGLWGIHICPEVMGKINQLGDVEEVASLCSLDERLIPCIDFGHYNARTHGGIQTVSDVDKVFDLLEDALGVERVSQFHSHFSRIEFTAGGEKKHWNYSDIQYGPDFDPVAACIAKRQYTPTIICESAGKMAQDAVILQKIYETEHRKMYA